MDRADAAALAKLIRGQRVAALGTLRRGAPFASMALYLPAEDFGAFHLHVSRLAWHTHDMQADPRVSLSIAEPDDGRADPQTLARVTLRGEATATANENASYEALKTAWLERFPESAINFELADFSFWRVAVRDARLVAGLGRIHNLSASDLAKAARCS